MGEKGELISRRHREANPKAVINIGGVKHEVIPTLTHRLHNVMYNTSTGIGIISRKLLNTWVHAKNILFQFGNF